MPAAAQAERPLSFAFAIAKVDEAKREVWGIATKEELDKQGDVVDYGASKAAFAAWPGNVREQHDPKKAVGRAIAVEPDDANQAVWVGVRVSKGAEDTWEKVKDGTLKGFSIAGKVLKAATEFRKDESGQDTPVQRITKYRLDELSLVDNPACPSAEIKVVKAAGAHPQATDVLDTDAEPAREPEPPVAKAEQPTIAVPGATEAEALGNLVAATLQKFAADAAAGAVEKRDVDPDVGGGVDRDKLPEEDFAGPHRSYPVVTPKDVADAADQIGRADDPDAVKHRLIAIARRKGPEFEAKLPDAWKEEKKSVDVTELAKALATLNDADRAALLAALSKGEYAAKDADGDDDGDKADGKKDDVADDRDDDPGHDGDGKKDDDGDGDGKKKAAAPAELAKLGDGAAMGPPNGGEQKPEPGSQAQMIHDAAVAMGAACNAAGFEQKAVGAQPDLTKALGASLTKLAEGLTTQFTAALTKALAERDATIADLAKRVGDVENQPDPRQALPVVRAVEKGLGAEPGGVASVDEQIAALSKAAETVTDPTVRQKLQHQAAELQTRLIFAGGPTFSGRR